MIGLLMIGVMGLFCGLMVSGGVFTALLALGLVPRFAGKTHTADRILIYESAVVYGCISGGLTGVLQMQVFLQEMFYKRGSAILSSKIWPWLSDGTLSTGGFFSGCFVGCVALAIAEMLDSIPIFARRINFRKGVGVAVLAVAVGKITGSLVYFLAQI